MIDPMREKLHRLGAVPDNVEIHIYRADPARHGGKEGFLWAIDRERRRRVYSQNVYDNRASAAMAAGLWLDALENYLERESGSG